MRNAWRNIWARLVLLKYHIAGNGSRRRWRRARSARAASAARPPAADGGGSRPLHIVYVTYYARAREFKLARAVRMEGHNVTLAAAGIQSTGLPTDDFDQIFHFSDVWEVMEQLEGLDADLVHLFVNYDNARMLPLLGGSPVPLVYDPYDCIRGMFRKGSRPYGPELKSERRFFERADHLCARSLEPLYLKREFGYPLPGVTYFPEYCWEFPAGARVRSVGAGEELHVVYCGGVWPEDRYSAADFGYAQYLEVARILADQQVHLHIYPVPRPNVAPFEEFYSLYLEEDAGNEYFHLHRPLESRELVEELRGYDAALHIFGPGIDNMLGRVTRQKLDYSSANKLFDYIEAGLPVLMHRGGHQLGLVRHYGRAIPLDELGSVRGRLTEGLGTPGPRTAGSCTLGAQAPRLGRMYERIARRRR